MSSMHPWMAKQLYDERRRDIERRANEARLAGRARRPRFVVSQMRRWVRRPTKQPPTHAEARLRPREPSDPIPAQRVIDLTRQSSECPLAPTDARRSNH